ncbi:MAG: hypothetical protein R3C03_02910 [Pirellulaceae bacterium]
MRHTLLTVGEETKDFEAVRAIMGHIDASISGQYREGVSSNRLESVCDVVRQWFIAGNVRTADLEKTTDKKSLK